MVGIAQKVGATSVTVLAKNASGKVLICSGTSAPTGAGYAKGCLFIKTDAGSGVKALYENKGTTAAAAFDVIGDIAAAEITLAEAKVLVGAATGLAAAQSLGGDVTVIADGTVTIGAKKVTNTKIAATVGTVLVGTKTSGDVTLLDISAEGGIPIGQGATETPAAAILSGDVTMDKTGAVTIGASKVVTSMVNAGAVTPVKMGILTKTVEATDGNITVLVAALLQGYLEKTNCTVGGKTLTFDTAANIQAAFVATVGAWFDWTFSNISTQAITLTTADGLTLKGTAAVPDGKTARVRFINTGVSTLDVVITLGA